MGSQGSTMNYNNLCFPENEDGLPPGWNPFHVQKGFKKTGQCCQCLRWLELKRYLLVHAFADLQGHPGWLEYFLFHQCGPGYDHFGSNGSRRCRDRRFRVEEGMPITLSKTLGRPAGCTGKIAIRNWSKPGKASSPLHRI